MTTPVIIQKMGQQMESGTITEWFVNDGEQVIMDDPLFSMETDKLEVEVTAPASGHIKVLHAEKVEELPVGEVVAYIYDEEESEEETHQVNQVAVTSGEESKPIKNENTSITKEIVTGASKVNSPERRIIASPYARKLARQYQLDLSEMNGSASNGRIIAQDILAFIEKQEKKKKSSVSVSDQAASKDVNDGTNAFPLSPMRKAITKTVEQSARTIVPVTITKSVQVDKLVSLREELKEEGYAISPNDFIIYAVSRSLKKFMTFNSVFSQDQVRQYQDIHIGFAVAVDDGLMIPVIRHADKKSLSEIADGRKWLVEGVRDQKLTNEYFEGGTFSISSLGNYDIDSFSPVVYPTQAAILGIGSIQKQPVVNKNGNLEVGHVLSLSLVFDHRVNDGKPGAELLNDIGSKLENPIKLII
ncbi:dihydrolipoamide acetyltransferase family protein [Pseudalkalibacillus decolorationis]|uniref:dihydrolipoamide acetyltransferase family protein n=1 Tax=Pseudalkalibacillus decolorationis TaxID=163879 RepID=UPI002147ADF2|nr:dihydrolipoamide acetyltransferase family protein [Pseudalkalibacillus decolorationis]